MNKTFCESCYEYVFGEKIKHCRSLNHDLILEKSKEDIDKTFLDFVNSKIIKFVVDENDNSRVIVKIQTGDGVFENYDISSTKFREIVAYSFYQEFEKILSEDVVDRLLNLIRVKATFNKNISKEEIHFRCASNESAIYYDLGNTTRQVVKIEPGWIETCNSSITDTPTFLRIKNTGESPEPVYESENKLDEFCKMLRVENDPVFKVHLVTMFLPHIPTPIMIIVGQEGSAKSTTTALIKMLIDPSSTKIKDQLSYFPRKVDDMNNHFANKYLIAYDNISHISPEHSDALCLAITGGGLSKRKLYTDNEEVTYNYQRKIILNGITVSPEHGDLARRSINYFTDRIPETERQTIDDLLKHFYEIWPDVLGEIFTILENALKEIKNIREEMPKLPDMADFALYGEAISRCMGNDPNKFLEEYAKKQKENNEILNESNPAVPFFLKEIGELPEAEYQMNKWFAKLTRYAIENGYDKQTRNFPKSVNVMRKWLERSKPVLFKAGLEVEIFTNTGTKYTKNATILKIKRAVIL